MSSFYVGKSASMKTGWRLMRETWADGSRNQETISRAAWPALGFHDGMSLDQARARAKQLNGESSIKRKEQRARDGQQVYQAVAASDDHAGALYHFMGYFNQGLFQNTTAMRAKGATLLFERVWQQDQEDYTADSLGIAVGQRTFQMMSNPACGGAVRDR